MIEMGVQDGRDGGVHPWNSDLPHSSRTLSRDVLVVSG